MKGRKLFLFLKKKKQKDFYQFGFVAKALGFGMAPKPDRREFFASFLQKRRLLLFSLAACPGYTVCPVVDYPRVLARPAGQTVLNSVDQQEAATLTALAGEANFGQVVALLGQAIAFDRNLSATRTQACGECHLPQASFAGGISAFARGGGIFPGATPHRTGFRTPQSLAYSGFAPVLRFDTTLNTFVGGNFWDSRATGAITGTPAADQPAVPLTSPVEMALPDPACAVRRVSQAPYGTTFAQIWGPNTFAIDWPANTDAICARLGAGGKTTLLRLYKHDRAQAEFSLQAIGLSVAAWEVSTLVSPFAAKFDQVQAGTAQFTQQEQAGYKLFTGRARCAMCHSAAGEKPLFTNFTSADIGVPRNGANPFLTENARDAGGYLANPAGHAFTDKGLGGFLASPEDKNPQWRAMASAYVGAFQVPTLRNAARPPGSGLVKSYMHNGYFTDLRSVVHFLNTRDVLPPCHGSDGVGVTCWPVAEAPLNVDHTLTGSLGLSSADEDALVAFIGTLSD